MASPRMPARREEQAHPAPRAFRPDRAARPRTIPTGGPARRRANAVANRNAVVGEQATG